jgi:hypothetical protein
VVAYAETCLALPDPELNATTSNHLRVTFPVWSPPPAGVARYDVILNGVTWTTQSASVTSLLIVHLRPSIVYRVQTIARISQSQSGVASRSVIVRMPTDPPRPDKGMAYITQELLIDGIRKGVLSPVDDSLLLGRLCANVLNVQSSLCYIVSTSNQLSRRRADAITLTLRARVSAALVDDTVQRFRSRLQQDSLVAELNNIDSAALQAITAVQLLGSANVTKEEEPAPELSTEKKTSDILIYAIIGAAVVVLLLILLMIYCCCERQAPPKRSHMDLSEQQGRLLDPAEAMHFDQLLLDVTMYNNAAYAPRPVSGQQTLPGLQLANSSQPPPVPTSARPSEAPEYSQIDDDSGEPTYEELDEQPSARTSIMSGYTVAPLTTVSPIRPHATRQFDQDTGRLLLPDLQTARQAWGSESGSAIVNAPALTDAEFDRLMIIRGTLVLQQKHSLSTYTDCYEGFIQQTSATVPVSVFQYNVDPEESDMIERLKHLSKSQQVATLLLGRHPSVLHTIAIQIDVVIQVLVARATGGSLAEYCQDNVLSLNEQMRLSLEASRLSPPWYCTISFWFL